ncbi:MAG: PhoD-like phosphatase N-terminal domain-containing protein [Actinobacteria bacterium]|nr:PhoD-like phosphatase N-terminal domain-containing protein [Actinomycetota bacterium]
MFRFPLVVVLVALALPATVAAQGNPFPLGVAAGEVTSSSAIVWTRAAKPGAIRLDVRSAKNAMPIARLTLRAATARDLTVQRRIFGLRPATRTSTRSRFRSARAGSSARGSSGRRPPRARRPRSASRSPATRTAPSTRRPGSLRTTSSRSTVGWPPSGTTSTSTSATRSTPTARSAACLPR